MIRFIELIIIAIHTGIIIYFSVDHSYVDMSTVNIDRLLHFIYFIFINIVYLQSFGHLWSVIFIQHAELAILMGMLFYQTFLLFSGYVLNSSLMIDDDIFYRLLSGLIAGKIITNGLMYSFYGLDRDCQNQRKSFVLEDFGVNIDHVYLDVWKLIIQIILLRILSFLLLRYHFGEITIWIFTKRKQFNQQQQNDIHCLQNDDKQPNIDPSSIDIDLSVINNQQRIKKEAELNFQRFSRDKIIIGWRSLSLFANESIYETRSINDTDDRLILNNLNGQLKFGTINALMGPSGSGKTSLLKILNGQYKTRLSDESEFFLSKFMPINTCYITQEISGHLLPGLTVLQSLIFASRLKNSNESTNSTINHECIAWKILQQLDMNDVAQTFVQNCSGGQRKRLAVGLELTSLRMPNLILIDEPTSGLDSNSSEIVITCLRRIAHEHNVTIVTSIHQPHTDLLLMFDSLYVLAYGGRCIYSGRSINISQYLQRIAIPQSKMFPIEKLLQYCSQDSNDNQIVQRMIEMTNQEIIDNGGQLLPLQTQLIIDGLQTNRHRFSLTCSKILFHRNLLYIINYRWKMFSMFIIFPILLSLVLRHFFPAKIAIENGCINLEDDFQNIFCMNSDFEIRKNDLQNNILYGYFSFFMIINLLIILVSVTFSIDMIYFHNEHRNGKNLIGFL